MKRRRSAAPAKAAPQPTKAPETPETKALTIDERNGLLRQCALPWSDVAAADFCATLPRHLLQEMTLAYVKANRKPDVLRTIGKIAALSFPDALTVQYVGKLPEVLWYMVMSFCTCADMARLHLVSRSMRALTLKDAAWVSLNMTDIGWIAFERLFPRAVRVARSICANHREYAWSEFARAVCEPVSLDAPDGELKPNVRLLTFNFRTCTDDAGLAEMGLFFPNLVCLKLQISLCSAHGPLTIPQLNQLLQHLHALREFTCKATFWVPDDDDDGVKSTRLQALVIPSRLLVFSCEATVDNGYVSEEDQCTILVESSPNEPSQLQHLRLMSVDLFGAPADEFPSLTRAHTLQLNVTRWSESSITSVLLAPSLIRLSLAGLIVTTLSDTTSECLRPLLQRLDLPSLYASEETEPINTCFATFFSTYSCLRELRVSGSSDTNIEAILKIVATHKTLLHHLTHLFVPAIERAFLAPPTDVTRRIKFEPATSAGRCKCTTSSCKNCACSRSNRLCGPQCHGY